MKRLFKPPLCLFATIFLAASAAIAQNAWTPSDGIEFDGATQYIQVDTLEGFHGDEFTLEAWIWLENLDGAQVFMNRGAASEDFTFYLYNGRIRMLVQDQSGYSHANAEPPEAGEWFHCAGVFQKDGGKRLYYNGELVATAPGAHRAVSNENPLTIGALLNGFSAERYLKGKMENIRIWDHALSHDEVVTLMKTRPGDENLQQMRENGLVGYWAARTRQGDVVQDLSGNGNHGEWVESAPEHIVVDATPAGGFEGIWYSNQPSGDEYVYKYSGGLGTYCAKHRHQAQYVASQNKTFFVYGGTKGFREDNALLIMAAYYDHARNQFARPVIVQEKGTSDAHHNPVLDIDSEGHLWIFASAHGGKDGFIWRSVDPYSIDRFELIQQKEFTYPQPRYIPGFGFLFLFTKYTGGREMYVNTSPDGIHWGEDKKICGFSGHYQVSEQHGDLRGTAFNWHPPVGGLNARTNLYYMQSADFGDTWTNVEGDVLKTPLDNPENGAMVHNYQAEGKLVYLKDLIYDPDGNPVILYTLSDGYESGPENGDRVLTTAHWTGDEWRFSSVTSTDHNYDMGPLWIEPGGVWKIIAPTEPGPQAYCTGGEIVLWESNDNGVTWRKIRQLTENSPRNHTYVRRVLNAHPDFYAFWADGDALKPSISHLYFCNRDGDKVWMMPPEMTGDFQVAEPAPMGVSGIH
ncbi:MAG: hypothetical protein GC154_02030 [bacterium]|nr:hypothetical protein [bacterium]